MGLDRHLFISAQKCEEMNNDVSYSHIFAVFLGGWV